MDKPPALALPVLRMVSEMVSPVPAAVAEGAESALTVRSAIGAETVLTTRSKLLFVMLLLVLTSPLPRDGLMLQTNFMPMVPTGSPAGGGKDTVWVSVSQGPRVETGAWPRC